MASVDNIVHASSEDPGSEVVTMYNLTGSNKHIHFRKVQYPSILYQQ